SGATKSLKVGGQVELQAVGARLELSAAEIWDAPIRVGHGVRDFAPAQMQADAHARLRHAALGAQDVRGKGGQAYADRPKPVRLTSIDTLSPRVCTPSVSSAGSSVWIPPRPPQTDQMLSACFISGGQGEWSEAIQSMAPSRTACQSWSTSSRLRSGGAHLAIA